ncbi:hypothetical protein L1887_47793 [Cichorium endivia]|nr:hypothetical protein L1887_47793 [Cichorium endivia]
MSRSRSPRAGSAGASRSSDNDDAPVASTSYRIERFDSSSTTDLMVTSRSKRSTAGNRLKALLDQELEKDEVFAEVENDVDFEANEHDDGVDIVDSDFDRDSDDDARAGVDDDSAGEREIEAQEKADKQKRRATARAVGIVKRPAPVRAPPEPKRRRISFAPQESTSRSSPSSTRAGSADSPAGRRSSARTATVQSKLQVETRLEEATQRKAAQPVRVVQKKKESFDAGCADRRGARGRGGEQGELAQVLGAGGGEEGKAEAEKGAHHRAVCQVGQCRAQDACRRGCDAAESTRRGRRCEQGIRRTTRHDDCDTAKRCARRCRSSAICTGRIDIRRQSQGHLRSLARSPQRGVKDVTCVQPGCFELAHAGPGSSSARRDAFATKPLPPHTLLPPPAPRQIVGGEKQARTLLSVERMPEDWEWLDEFNALLGTHCNWESYPFVPHRNRPLRPRQSVCPITGLPAIYKDPRTGIPYATAHAYGVITKVIQQKFRWSNAQWGIYTDHEDEPGPAKVWQKAREISPKPKPEESKETKEERGKEKQKEKEKEDKRSKPGFDVVLTNAIAPGDEKALLAQALSLPAGSTRSGRRVHRT